MSGITLPNMSLELPELGGDSGSWDDILEAVFTILDAHSHVSGSGVPITPDAIDIDADLTFAGHAATNVGKVAFTAVTALASGSKSLFCSVSDNELYWRTSGGTNVKLTSGSSLNVAAFVGGIGGDYSSVSALVAFDDANDRYTFKQNSATGWARMASGEVRILETGTSESVYVGIAAPAALGASYTLTLATALPGSTAIAQVSSAGVLTYSNTIVSLITASAGLTAAADTHVTVSGTGEFKHGDKVLNWAAYNAVNDSGGTSWSLDTSSPMEWRSTASGVCGLVIPFRTGDRVKTMNFALKGDGAADLVTTIYKQPQTGAAATIINIGGVATTTSNQAASYSTITIDLIDTTLSAGDTIFVTFSANASGLRIGTMTFTYDRP